jgi:sugar phosphate isomerase/epimerase
MMINRSIYHRRYGHALRHGLIAIFLCFSITNPAQTSSRITHQTPVRFSLNAYSFNARLLEKNPSDGRPVFSLIDLIDWAATQNLEAIDITGYYFPGYPTPPSDAVIQSIRNRAAARGLSISGTGIRNHFASSDPSVREEGITLAKRWIDVAAKLGAPVIRLFAGAMPVGYENRWDEVMAWMVPCFRQCAAYAQTKGVKIGIQNHADALSTADQTLRLLKAIDHPWVGLIVDTGSFTTSDPYTEIAMTAPYAINWQVKERLHGEGPDRKTDMLQVMKIIKESGYKGFVPVETLPEKGKEYDPFSRVPALLSEMQSARSAVFN